MADSKSPNFEIHITCHVKDAVKVENYIEHDTKWKFSVIDGDPLLGKKPHCYLTGHTITYPFAKDKMEDAVYNLGIRGVEIIRQKIELIVYDSKTGIELDERRVEALIE